MPVDNILYISFLPAEYFITSQPSVLILASQRFHILPAINFIACQPAISFWVMLWEYFQI
jgi:hypothetical protein